MSRIKKKSAHPRYPRLIPLLVWTRYPTTELFAPHGQLKDLEIKEGQDLYDHAANQMIAAIQITHIEQLTESIYKIEKAVVASARDRSSYSRQLLPSFSCAASFMPATFSVNGKSPAAVGWACPPKCFCERRRSGGACPDF